MLTPFCPVREPNLWYKLWFPHPFPLYGPGHTALHQEASSLDSIHPAYVPYSTIYSYVNSHTHGSPNSLQSTPLCIEMKGATSCMRRMKKTQQGPLLKKGSSTPRKAVQWKLLDWGQKWVLDQVDYIQDDGAILESTTRNKGIVVRKLCWSFHDLKTTTSSSQVVLK